MPQKTHNERRRSPDCLGVAATLHSESAGGKYPSAECSRCCRPRYPTDCPCEVSKAGTQVVVISTGTVQDNRKQGFRSHILLDQNFSAGKAFGAGGTPSGLLLDEQSKIASKVAVGKQEIVDSIFGAQVAAGARL